MLRSFLRESTLRDLRLDSNLKINLLSCIMFHLKNSQRKLFFIPITKKRATARREEERGRKGAGSRAVESLLSNLLELTDQLLSRVSRSRRYRFVRLVAETMLARPPKPTNARLARNCVTVQQSSTCLPACLYRDRWLR